MSERVSVRLETFSVLGLDAADGGERVRAVLEEALARVASRLASSPFGRAGIRELALERLELGALAADELCGPRGAERLADALYAALSRRIG
jgi:hypothetical protein